MQYSIERAAVIDVATNAELEFQFAFALKTQQFVLVRSSIHTTNVLL